MKNTIRILGLLLICSLVAGLFGNVAIKAASKVKLSSSKKTMYIGETFSLTLNNAKGKVKWSSTDSSVATVSGGTVTAVGTGKATIKAKDTGTKKTYKCEITVKKNALSAKKLELKVGETGTLSLKGGVSATWSSSKKSVAKVDNGMVTALKSGSTKITATVGGKKYTCKVTVTEKEPDTDTDKDKDKDKDKEPVTEPETVELTLMMLGVDEDPLDQAYSQAIEELKEVYPNVKLNIVRYDNEEYKGVVKAKAREGSLPDIFFTWSCSFLGDFVDRDSVYCLDNIYTKYISKGDINEAMLNNTTYNGKHYGVPLTMNVACMYANMDILEKVGYTSIPSTSEELLECCGKLIKEGITPFAVAGAEEWCIAQYLEPLMQSKVGAAALRDIFDGKASFDNPAIVSAAAEFQKMVQEGYFNSNMMEVDNMGAQEIFFGGNSAFLINGSWVCAMIADDPELYNRTQVAPVPYATQGEYIGGPSDTLAVSVSSPNAELAAEYTVALGRLISKYSYLEGAGLPAWKIDYDDSAVNSLTRTVAGMCAKASDYTLFGDTELKSEYVEAYLSCLSRLLSGDIKAEDFTSILAPVIK